jgi:hypothetical protein
MDDLQHRLSLHDLEQSLTLTVGTLDEGQAERAAEVASAIVDRALAQLAGDARRYLAALDFMACDGCPLCEDEAREAGARPPSRHGRSPTSFRR